MSVSKKYKAINYFVELCPCCGKQAYLRQENKAISVWNTGLHIDINDYKMEYFVQCKCGIRTKYYKTPYGAVRHWNQRKGKAVTYIG